MLTRHYKSVVKLAGLFMMVIALPFTSASAQASSMDGVTLRVGTYGGVWKDAVEEHVSKKLEAMGIKIEYVIGNPAENFSKVIAARGQAVPIDVMELGPVEQLAMSRNDFLEDLPVDKIPNLSEVSVKVVEGKTIAHQMVENGILYRTDKFESGNLPVPKTFEDLQNAKLANQTAFPDVTNPQHWPAVAAMASVAGGSEADPQKGFDEVMKTKPLSFYGAATELSQKMAMGDVIAAPSHAGMAVRMKNAGLAVGFVHPNIGEKHGEVEYNYLGIVKGTKQADAAAAFINAFLEAEAQVEFAKKVGIVPVNREARKTLMQDPVINEYMLLSDEELANTFSMDWSKVNVEAWRAAWTRTVNK